MEESLFRGVAARPVDLNELLRLKLDPLSGGLPLRLFDLFLLTLSRLLSHWGITVSQRGENSISLLWLDKNAPATIE